MSNGMPPGMPPGMPTSRPQQSATLSPQLVTRSELKQGLLNAASTATRVKAELLAVAAALTQAEHAVTQTADFVMNSDSLIMMNGLHTTPQQMAAKMGLAGAADVKPVIEALTLIRATSESIPVHMLEKLSKLESGNVGENGIT